MIKRVEVRGGLDTTTSGHRGPSVTIDGTTLPGVRAVDVSLSPGFIPTVTLELQAQEVDVEGDLALTLPDATVAALKRLGWTEPQ